MSLNWIGLDQMRFGGSTPMSRKSEPTGFSSSMIVSIGFAEEPVSPASSTSGAPLSTSTTSNLPLGRGPSARGESAPAAGGSTSRAITAAWLCAISCAKVSDTAEQNGQASTRTGRPRRAASRIATAMRQRRNFTMPGILPESPSTRPTRHGAAHALSPDARYGHPCPSLARWRLRSRHPAFADQSAKADRCPANADSQGMGSPGPPRILKNADGVRVNRSRFERVDGSLGRSASGQRGLLWLRARGLQGS